MSTGDWNGDVTVTIVIIALVICFAWFPIVTIFSICHNAKQKYRAFFERRGWVAPAVSEEKRTARQQKMPEIPKPMPTLPTHSARGVERAMSTRSYGSAASWEPLRRWETTSSGDTVPLRQQHYDPTGMSRNNSMRSNFSRPMPMPSRASSVRSVASMHPASAAAPGPSRSRRPSMNGPPPSFQMENAYYDDTTPLPDRPPSAVRAHSRSPSSSRSHPTVPSGSGSRSRRDSSVDIPRQPRLSTAGRTSEEQQPRNRDARPSTPYEEQQAQSHARPATPHKEQQPRSHARPSTPYEEPQERRYSGQAARTPRPSSDFSMPPPSRTPKQSFDYAPSRSQSRSQSRAPGPRRSSLHSQGAQDDPGWQAHAM